MVRVYSAKRHKKATNSDSGGKTLNKYIIKSQNFYTNETKEAQYPLDVFLTVNSVWLAHGGVKVERLDILPALLKEGNEEVDAHVNVLSQVFGVHFNISDWGGHVQDFLKLEPDGVSNFLNLLIDA